MKSALLAMVLAVGVMGSSAMAQGGFAVQVSPWRGSYLSIGPSYGTIPYYMGRGYYPTRPGYYSGYNAYRAPYNYRGYSYYNSVPRSYAPRAYYRSYGNYYGHRR